jgi:hypothetical protein
LRILALDLGTTTGWALSNSSGLLHSGTHSFKASRFEGAGMRFLKFEKFLVDLRKDTGGFDLILFEEVRRHMGVDAAHAYGGYLATLQRWAEAWSIGYSGVPVGTIKQFATGKGNAKKDAMVEAAVRLHAPFADAGWKPVDDNQADAVCLLHYGLKTYATTRPADSGPAPRRRPRKQLQVEALPLAR